jgi:hypothetical protein
MKYRLYATAPLLAMSLCGCVLLPVEQSPSVVGTVREAGTLKPVVGAEVRYKDFPSEAVAVTTVNGGFKLGRVVRWQVVVVGTDRQPVRALTVSALGYKPAIVAVDLGGPSEYTVLLERTQ